MTTITPTYSVRIDPRHAAGWMHPDDAAQQAHFMALGQAGHDEAVQREVTASIKRQKLHMDNVGVLLRERMT